MVNKDLHIEVGIADPVAACTSSPDGPREDILVSKKNMFK